MINSKHTLPYEEAAEQLTREGWVCKTCNRFWGNDEHMARWCCSKDLPCKCGGRIEKGYTMCESCRDKHDEDRFAKAERVEWNGEWPLCVWRGDEYFWSADDLQDYIDRHDIKIEDLRLVTCVPQYGPSFSMNDYLCDVLPEDGEVDSGEIDAIVNNWINSHGPFSWLGTGKVITISSLNKHADVIERSDVTDLERGQL